MFSSANENYRRVFKEGMKGWDVAVLQANLPSLVVDGRFGPNTTFKVKEYQRAHNLEVDGIAGIRTQQSIALVNSNGAQNKYRTPGGLLRGLMEGESGFQLAATTHLYPNGSRDVGVYQENLSSAELSAESTARDSFVVAHAAERSAHDLRQTKDIFSKLPGGYSDEKAWRYAVLNHNWPAAAAKFAAGTIDSWVYMAKDLNGITREYQMSDQADWIKAIGVNGVSTGYQWADFYVDSKVVYVRSWTP